MTDPWLDKTAEANSDTEGNQPENNNNNNSDTDKQNLQFEDNFASTSVSGETNGSEGAAHQPLPDSSSYLQGLERKLAKLREGTKLVEALTAKREDCMRNLLDEHNPSLVDDESNALNEPVNNSEIYRHIQPVQPVTVGETVHIVNYDQLDEQHEDQSDDNDKENNQVLTNGH